MHDSIIAQITLLNGETKLLQLNLVASQQYEWQAGLGQEIRCFGKNLVGFKFIPILVDIKE